MAISWNDWREVAAMLEGSTKLEGSTNKFCVPNTRRTPEGCNDRYWEFDPDALPEKREGWRDPPTPLPPQGGGSGRRSGDYA